MKTVTAFVIFLSIVPLSAMIDLEKVIKPQSVKENEEFTIVLPEGTKNWGCGNVRNVKLIAPPIIRANDSVELTFLALKAGCLLVRKPLISQNAPDYVFEVDIADADQVG